jgi:hypothetical protein
MKEAIKRQSKKIGPGGIKCSCCQFDTHNNMKKFISRHDRRKNRQEIVKEID